MLSFKIPTKAESNHKKCLYCKTTSAVKETQPTKSCLTPVLRDASGSFAKLKRPSPISCLILTRICRFFVPPSTSYYFIGLVCFQSTAHDETALYPKAQWLDHSPRAQEFRAHLSFLHVGIEYISPCTVPFMLWPHSLQNKLLCFGKNKSRFLKQSLLQWTSQTKQYINNNNKTTKK